MGEQAVLSRKCGFGCKLLADRPVRQMPLCSAPVEGGSAVRFFVSALVFSGSSFGVIFGCDFLFSVACCGLVFFDGVLPRFLFMARRFAPETALKLFSRQVLFFWVHSFCLKGSRVDDVLFALFSRERDSSGSNRTPHTPARFRFVPFSFFFPLRFVRPFFLAFLSGCRFGPRAFFGFSRNVVGLELARPL